MNIGFKHFTTLQWVGAFCIVSLPLTVIAIFGGYMPHLWWLILGANVVVAFFSVFFIAWPGKDGFNNARSERKN